MTEPICNSYRRIGTEEGEIEFGTATRNSVKMAVMIRRIFPTAKFTTSQYIALQMDGHLDGAVIVSAPSLFTVLCGEKPIKADSSGNLAGALGAGEAADNGVGAYIRAENGDIIISAPRGRIKLQAEDIDLISNGNGGTTGFVNIISNSTVDVSAPTVNVQGKESLGLSGDRNLNLNCTGSAEVNARSLKVIETPDVSPVTGLLGSGSNTLLQIEKGLKKLIESIT